MLLSPLRCAAAALLALCATAAAQEPPGRTVVSALRAGEPGASPARVVVVTGEELERTGEPTLPRALGKAANLWIQESTPGGGAPVIDGLIGNRVLVVLDGVRLNDSTSRTLATPLASIDPAIVERIEVVRGPASVLYGSDAMGGAILVWTRGRAPAGETGARGLGGAVELHGDSAYEGGRAALEVSGASRDHGFLAIGSLEDYQDLRAGGGEELDETGFESDALFGAWDWALDPRRDLRLTARLDRILDLPRHDRLVPGFGQSAPSDAEWRYALLQEESWLATYVDRAPGALAEQLELRLYARRSDQERVIRDVGSTLRTREDDEVATLGLGLDLRTAVGNDHLLTWGFDLANDVVDSRRTDVDLATGIHTPKDGAFADDARYAYGGVFVQDEVLAFQPYEVVLGARWSWFDYAFDQDTMAGEERERGDFGGLTASASIGREVARGMRLTGSVAQGFRAPNLEDLANTSTFAGGVELPSADLDPERNLTGRLALDLARARWSASLGAWFSALDDLIGRRLVDAGDPTEPGDETWQRANVGRGEVYGADLAARVLLGPAETPWSLGAALAWTRGNQFDDTIDPTTGTAPLDDVPFRRIPPLHGQLGLRWEPPQPRRGLGWAELSVRAAAEQDELNPQDELDPRIDPDGTGGWAVLDLDLGGPLGGAGSGSTWLLGLHNLLDEEYRVHASAFDAPGFAVVAGLRLAF